MIAGGNPTLKIDEMESKDLRTIVTARQIFGAKIPPRASLGRDDSCFCFPLLNNNLFTQEGGAVEKSTAPF
jgi:hypothetical protein